MSDALTHGSSTSEITACVEAGCLLVPAQAAAIMEQLAAAESARAALEAENKDLRELLRDAYGGLIYELEQMEQEAKEQGREVWDRQLMGGGHFRVHDIQDARALLASPASGSSSGPQTGDPCAQCGDPIPDAPTGHLCQRCHHDAFKTDLDRSAGEGEAG